MTKNVELMGFYQDRTVLGIIMMVGFCITAPLLDVAAKLAADKISTSQITSARFIIQALIMLPVVWMLGFSFKLTHTSIKLLFLRAIFLIIATYCFVAAIAVMPIADALAIVFVEPFILLLMGKIIFGEKVGVRRIGASLVGFLGVVLVIQPSFLAFGSVAFYPLGTAVSFAFYMLVTRGLSRYLHPIQMQFHTAFLGSLICLPVLFLGQLIGTQIFNVMMPEGIYWLWLFGVGFFASISHLLLSYALKFTPSATLAPLHYLEILSSVILGYLIFSDLPNRMAFTGMLIVVISGLYIFFREQKLARK